MIIGLVGFKQVGKSTAATHLETVHRFKRLNFKDALVAEMRQNLGKTMEEMIHLLETVEYDGMDPWTVDKLFRVKPPVFRALMQEYGTEVRRGDDPLYWIKQWENAITDENTVVDDVRFINEADAVLNKGGIIVRLTRPDIATGGSHPSETEQLSIEAHHTIDVAPGEYDKLYRALDKIVSGGVVAYTDGKEEGAYGTSSTDERYLRVETSYQ